MCEDILADAANDRRQAVAAYVCVGLIKHTVRCPEIVEDLHHALHVAALLGAGEELAVRERAGTSFAKAVVRLGIEAHVAVE